MKKTSLSSHLPSSGGGGASGGGIDLKCKIKYQNNLPDVPFEPKSLAYPFDANRYINYKPTTLEKQFKWDILNEQDMGIRIDLINQDYNRFNPDSILDPKDEKLLEEDTTTPADLKRSEQHNKMVSWMRRNEYISTENTRFMPKQYENAEAKVGFSMKNKYKGINFYKTRESQVEAIENLFEAVKKPAKNHYSKPGVTAVEELPIFPDFELWPYASTQVLFDDDPAPKQISPDLQYRSMSEALIKGLVDKSTNEQFVAYFLPTDETMRKQEHDAEMERSCDPEDEYDFKLAREYTWNIKTKKVGNEYDESYYFIIKDDGIYYNPLETRVRLTKRRTNKSKVGNTRLAVKYRDFTTQEKKNQTYKLRELNLVVDYDDSEEEEEEEEEVEQNEGSPEGSVNIEKGEEEEEEEEEAGENGEEDEHQPDEENNEEQQEESNDEESS